MKRKIHDKELAGKVRAARLARGMSQSQLSKAALGDEAKYYVVSQIETQGSAPSTMPDAIMKVLAFLDSDAPAARPKVKVGAVIDSMLNLLEPLDRTTEIETLRFVLRARSIEGDIEAGAEAKVPAPERIIINPLPQVRVRRERARKHATYARRMTPDKKAAMAQLDAAFKIHQNGDKRRPIKPLADRLGINPNRLHSAVHGVLSAESVKELAAQIAALKPENAAHVH